MPDLLPLPPLPNEDGLGRLIDAAAPLLGIPVEAAWRAPIVANLQTVATAARLVLEFPLDDELEPAAVFRA